MSIPNCTCLEISPGFIDLGKQILGALSAPQAEFIKDFAPKIDTLIKLVTALVSKESTTILGGGTFFSDGVKDGLPSAADVLQTDNKVKRALVDFFGAIGGPFAESLMKQFNKEAGLNLGLALGLGLGGGCSILFGFRYIIKKMETPPLIDQIRWITPLDPLYKAFENKIASLWKKNTGKTIAVAPVFEEEISRKIQDITKGIRNTVTNKGYFQNILFYGPGGVGKTMICDKLAEDANINFIKMSGGNFAQFITRGDHVTQLNRLFDKIDNATLPTVLFIDEAESLCRDRKKQNSAQFLELQNAFLHRTGSPSKKLILCMATNLIEELDPAILTRMDYKISMSPPALAERIKIIKTYIPKFFSSRDAALFTVEKIQQMAEKIEGATGRAIFKLLNQMQIKKTCTGKNILTEEIIDQKIQDWISEENSLTQHTHN